LVLTNTNSTNPLKGGGLFQLLTLYVSGGVLYPSFYNGMLFFHLFFAGFLK
jgi:hypothetical protein